MGIGSGLFQQSELKKCHGTELCYRSNVSPVYLFFFPCLSPCV